jgi:hypothetical protein
VIGTKYEIVCVELVWKREVERIDYVHFSIFYIRQEDGIWFAVCVGNKIGMAEVGFYS